MAERNIEIRVGKEVLGEVPFSSIDKEILKEYHKRGLELAAIVSDKPPKGGYRSTEGGGREYTSVVIEDYLLRSRNKSYGGLECDERPGDNKRMSIPYEHITWKPEYDKGTLVDLLIKEDKPTIADIKQHERKPVLGHISSFLAAVVSDWREIEDRYNNWRDSNKTTEVRDESIKETVIAGSIETSDEAPTREYHAIILDEDPRFELGRPTKTRIRPRLGYTATFLAAALLFLGKNCYDHGRNYYDREMEASYRQGLNDGFNRGFDAVTGSFDLLSVLDNTLRDSMRRESLEESKQSKDTEKQKNATVQERVRTYLTDQVCNRECDDDKRSLHSAIASHIVRNISRLTPDHSVSENPSITISYEIENNIVKIKNAVYKGKGEIDQNYLSELYREINSMAVNTPNCNNDKIFVLNKAIITEK